MAKRKLNPNLLRLAELTQNPDLDMSVVEEVETKGGELEGKLGVEYGLVFCTTRGGGPIYTSLDGVEVRRILSGKNHSLFLDSNTQKLYYIIGNCLYKWHEELIKDFGTEAAWGVGKCKGEILIALYNSGQIVDLKGNMRFEELKKPLEFREFKGELYHVESEEGRGLVRTATGESVKKTGNWVNGLCVLDKLYFGGSDEIIYSYDCSNVNKVCSTDFCIWGLCGVGDKEGGVVYAGGNGKKGMLVVSLDNPQNMKTILEGKVKDVLSIVTAPVGFIEKLNKEAGV